MAFEGGIRGSKGVREDIAKDIDNLLASSDEDEEEEEPHQKETASGEEEEEGQGKEASQPEAAEDGERSEKRKALEQRDEPEPAQKKSKPSTTGRKGDLAPYKSAEPPHDLGRTLVCCMPCKLLKTESQFYELGCENCGYLNMRGDRDQVRTCTTTNFEGIISIMDPTDSWAFKWLRYPRKNMPGCYAMQMNEALPAAVEEMLEDQGIKLRR